MRVLRRAAQLPAAKPLFPVPLAGAGLGVGAVRRNCEKLLLKLNAAAQIGVEKAITFEFSHFMSPNSAYLQARHLYNRYREHFGLLAAEGR